jgi:glycosyltransferase involved in cell wall biosynthesis/uncharacterized radical SAM superfamily protein
MLHKLEWLRQRGHWSGKIIVGGPHATVCLDTIPGFVDFVVQGEGEKAIIDIVEGRVEDRVVNYQRIKNLDDLPMPAWDYFVNMPYDWGGEFFPEKPVFSMNTSRGCPYSCKFCSVNSIWGKLYTYFSAERIVNDIEHLIKKYGAKGIYFREDNFTLNRKRLTKFCNLILERGIKISWACETRVNTLDHEIVELMKKAGACGFYFGVESGSQKVLNFLNKDIEIDQTRQAFNLCHQYGIKTAASVVVGVPNETKSDLKETLALLDEIKPTITWFNVFVGIPNSTLYKYTLENKLYEFIDDRGLIYLRGHNERVKIFYGGRWDATTPFINLEKPKLSVVMSVYNGEEYVESAIKSILTQTYHNYEFVIVDDASTDDTRKILKKFDDPRIKIIKNFKNIGLTKSLNKGILATKGKFIARMDADDISLPHRLEKQIYFLDNNVEYALVGSSYYRINANGETCELIDVLNDDKDIKKGLRTQNWFGHGSVMMRRDAILEAGGYDEAFKYAQDYDLWLKLSENNKLANMEEPLYCWRCTESSITHKNGTEQRDYANFAIAESQKRANKIGDDQETGLLISVIVPTFNRPWMLKDSIKSILSQTYNNFEIVVVNDAGEDVSELLRKFQDHRIKYIQHEKNKGLAAARNTGIKNASGQFIALLDDDDIFYPEHLEIAVKNLGKEYPVIYTDAVRATYERCGNTHKLLKKNVPYSIDFDRNKLLLGNISPVNCFVFDKNLAFEAGLFDETLSTLEDWEFWIRLSAQIPFKHVAQPTVQVNWRNDGTTMTSLLGSDFKKNRQRIYSKYQNEINQIPNKTQIYKEFQKIWTQDRQVESQLTSIIILTHNELELTQKCVNSVINHTTGAYEIIFVDNGSSDRTCDYLTDLVQRHQNFNLIANSENKGFAAGNNQGIAAARGDYILLMNNDIVVTPGWLERMVSCAERDPRIGIVGPMSNSVSGPQLVKDVTYNVTELGGLDDFAAEFSKKNAGKAKRHLRVVGFCMLIKRAVIDKIGGLDDRYGLGNFEDDDFSLRAALAGFESWMAGDCFIHHFGNRTFIGAKIDYNESLTKNWEIFKNKWGFPTDLQLGSNYNWAQILKEGFVQEKHCCPLNQRNYVESGQKGGSPLLSDAGSLNERYQKVQRLVDDGRQEEAIGELERLLEMDHEFAMAHNDLGILFYSQGDKEKALNHYSKKIWLIFIWWNPAGSKMPWLSIIKFWKRISGMLKR